MVRFLVLSIATGLSTAGALYGMRFQDVIALPALTVEQCLIAGLGMSLLTLLIGLIILERRLLERLTALRDANVQFEEAATRRAAELERLIEATRGDLKRIESAPPSSSGVRTPVSALPSRARPSFLAQVEDAAPSNVVVLDSGARSRADSPSGAASDLQALLRDHQPEAWFRPIIGLPSRATRILECVPQMVMTDPVPTAEWVPVARHMGLLPRHDVQMLIESMRLLRDLKRTDKPGSVLWRLSPELLASDAEWQEAKELLKAGTALSAYFVCDIAVEDFIRLENEALERLHAVRDWRYRLSLDGSSGFARMSAAVAGGLFEIARAPVGMLLEGAAGRGGLARMRDTARQRLELIAMDIVNEDQVIALIDHDILLAQGPLIGAAKPLKRSRQAGQSGQSA